MKRVLEFLKDRRVIVIIGLLALSILIWFVGPYVRFGESNYAPLGSVVARLIAIMILVGIWGLNNLRVQMQNRKSNDDLIEGMQEAQGDAGSHESSMSAEELAILDDRFKQALATLRKIKFKNARGNKKVVYELPWYIIIGPPGSGKTTALVNSGLEFPLAEKFGKGALKGIGGTRNCDWWFTNEAVLLDTAGRYTTQDSHRVIDSTAWQGFLDLLKRNRRRRPINGAIIAFSLQDLLVMTDDERMRHAKTIRTRIDELMEQLGVRFPIYLMFTKADLISGFTEFFDYVGMEDREQVWGATFEDSPDPSFAANIDWFANQYDALIKRLNDRVLWRVHEERDVRRRGAIQAFPQQMENLKGGVVDFLKHAFAPSRYHTQPYLRGVYFTSGTQDGTPIDRLMSSVASNFGFAREVAQMQGGQGKSYFISRLFKEIVFPEADLVGTNKRFEKTMMWGQRATYAGLALVAVGLLAAWTGAITRNKTFLHDVGEQVAIYKHENADGRARLDSTLASLDALREASRVYDRNEHPWLSGFGLYDESVDEAAKDAYEKQLERLLIPQLKGTLESRLKDSSKDKLELYDALRVYLMFEKSERMDKVLLSRWFSDYWAERYGNDEITYGALERHMGVLMGLDEFPVTSVNESLVQSRRELLRSIPPARRVISELKSDPQYSQEFDLRNEVGDNFSRSFVVRGGARKALQMPFFYTKPGYKSLDFGKDSDMIRKAAKERWVLWPDDDDSAPPTEAELKKLGADAEELYLKEYAARWHNFLDSMDIAKFKGVRDGKDKVAILIDTYSPLMGVMELVSHNTKLTFQPSLGSLTGEGGDGAADKAKGALGGALATRLEGNRVDKEFKELNALMKESSRGPARISEMLSILRELHDYLNEISSAPNSSQAAFTAAKARFQGGGDAIRKLRNYASTQPEPVKRWMLSVADESWRVVLGSAKHHLNTEWREQVYSKYRRALSGRYPLSRKAKDELAIYDFAEFFKPEGTLDVFTTEYLSPFVNMRRNWRVNAVDGRGLGISKGAVAQLKRARRIRQVFFREDPGMPSVSFQIKPYRMDREVAKFDLEMGGRNVSYSHGPKIWRDLKWPGDDEATRARVVFEDLAYESTSLSYEGPWAWFRLLDASKLRSVNRSNVYRVTFKVRPRSGGDPLQAEFDIKAKSVNNPFSRNLLGSFRCPEAL